MSIYNGGIKGACSSQNSGQILLLLLILGGIIGAWIGDAIVTLLPHLEFRGKFSGLGCRLL